MSGICDTCKRNKDCRKPIGGMDSCRLYVSGKESNYEKLFGTPEKAAQTLSGKCSDCFECVLANACEHGCDEGCLLNDESMLLEWLRGEA